MYQYKYYYKELVKVELLSDVLLIEKCFSFTFYKYTCVQTLARPAIPCNWRDEFEVRSLPD